MTILQVKNTMYDLETFLGDSGTITIGNLPTDSNNYTLWIQVNGKQTVIKNYALNGASEQEVDFSVEDINSIGQGQWPYGVKLSNGDEEDTYIPDLRVSPQALFVVKKLVVEGPTNTQNQEGDNNE